MLYDLTPSHTWNIRKIVDTENRLGLPEVGEIGEEGQKVQTSGYIGLTKKSS